MPIMTWDASLDVGVESMNKEHQEILDKMNEIFDAAQSGTTGAPINRLVGELGQITTGHFADEEAFMESIGFANLAQHKLQHQALLEKFTKHAEAIEAAGGVARAEFFHFLRFWLASHIKGIDIKYGEHARLKEAG